MSTRVDVTSGAEVVAERRYLVLFCCCFALFIVTLENTIANVALPNIQASLGAGDQLLQWIVDSYVVLRGSLLMTAGALSDRFGRRRTFQAGLVIFGLGSALCAVAPNGELLVAFRLVQAVGGAALTPSTMAITVATFTDPRERARAIGFFAATIGFGTALGPLVGGVLVTVFGWTSVFWIDVPLAAAAFALSVLFMEESRTRVPRQLDPAGQVLATATLASLTFALIEEPGRGWSAPAVLAPLLGGFLLLAAFLSAEKRHREPLLELSAFRNRTFVGATVLAFAVFFAFNAFIFFNTLYLQGARGHGPLSAGLITLPATIATFALGPLSGRLTGRYGSRLPASVASVLIVAGLVDLALLGPEPAGTALALAYVLIGAGIGIASPAITTAAVAGMPADRAGVAAGTTIAARQVGAAFGIALVGTIVFNRFSARLPAHLEPLRLTAAKQASIAHDSAGSIVGGLGTHAVQPSVVHAVGLAFTDGLRAGYLATAFLCAVALVVGWMTLGPRPDVACELDRSELP